MTDCRYSRLFRREVYGLRCEDYYIRPEDDFGAISRADYGAATRKSGRAEGYPSTHDHFHTIYHHLRSQFMAAKTAMRSFLRPAIPKFTLSVCATTRRSLTTPPRHICQQHPRALIQPTLSRSGLSRPFRRSYAATVSPPTKRRGRGFFRWTWRIMYLSAIGGLGYLAYTIYLLRTPPEQLEADPSKKTLVILGQSSSSEINWHQLTIHRHRLGRCLSPQETQHRKLQCHRHLPTKLLPLHPPPSVLHDRNNRTPLHHGARAQHPPPQKSHREIL